MPQSKFLRTWCPTAGTNANRKTCCQMRGARALLLIILASGSVVADDKIPANFLHGRESLTNPVDIPGDMPEGMILLRCAAIINSKGAMRHQYCILPAVDQKAVNNPRDYEAAAVRATQNIQLTPAIVNGKPQAVAFNFSVVLINFGGQLRTEIYPNHLWDFGAYGADYIEAQRLARPASRKSFSCPASPWSIWISARVNASGRASDAKMITGNASAICVKNIISQFAKSDFIPAVKDGRNVESTYVEEIWNGAMDWYHD